MAPHSTRATKSTITIVAIPIETNPKQLKNKSNYLANYKPRRHEKLVKHLDIHFLDDTVSLAKTTVAVVSARSSVVLESFVVTCPLPLFFLAVLLVSR
jgi:hypothetical protein